MAAILKFRRGTLVPTSIDVSEPYFHETKYTLNIGVDGAGGWVTLANMNWVNEGDFRISSNLYATNADFTGNVDLDGDLFVGGSVTIGDGGDDTVIVGAPLSGSLIPTTGSAFDIGSVSKPWRHIYADSATIGDLEASSIDWDNVYNTPPLISGSSQVDHNLTQNYQVNRHIDHSGLGITAGDGLLGGGILTATRTIHLDGSGSYFYDSVENILNALNIISGSGQVDYNDLTNIPSGIVSGSSQLDGTTIDGLTLTEVTASGAFTGDGSGLTGVPTSSVTYDPPLSDTLAMPQAVGGYPQGTTVADLRGDELETMFSDLLFPTVEAYIQPAKSVSFSGVSNQTLEIGTTITPNTSTVFTTGTIVNGDDTNGPNLVGNANLYTYRLPNGNIDGSNTVGINTDSFNYSTGYKILAGSNNWTVTVAHDAGTGLYYDNKAVASSNLDGSRIAGSVVRNSGTKTGRYYARFGSGISGSAPTDSAGVRGLGSSQALNSSNNGTFNITIPSGTQEVYFFCPAGKSITVLYVESSNADVSGTFTETTFDVNDAGGNPISYSSFVSYIGAVGYPSTATYNVTIS